MTEKENSMDLWTLRVEAIITEASETKTIFFRREDGPLSYRAGQFLTLLFYPRGHELRRSYSFCTTPDIDPLPGITVKRVPNGEISRYLLDHLHVGDMLRSLPPSGRFFLDETADTHFFLAAGSGLVPIFSLLKQALLSAPNAAAHAADRFPPLARAVLVTQQHDRAGALFYDTLQVLSSQFGTGRLTWIDLLTVRDGRLNNWGLEEWLFRLLPRVAFSGTRFYVCGPPAFMRMAQYTLRTLGITEAQIKKEHFTVERYAAPPPVFDKTPRKVVIRDGPAIHVFETKWPHTILQSGLDQGIHLPYSCRAGRCSTCVARCVEGRVKMTNNEVLTDNDLREGLVLTCVGYAETDVELRFGNPAGAR